MSDWKSPISYTADNWTVASQYSDSITTGKAITIPDIDWANDYALKEQGPGVALYHNITSMSLGVPETIQFKNRPVTDIYAKSAVPSAYRYSMKGGVNVGISVHETVKAVNSVSGDIVLFPIPISLSLTVPTASFIDTSVLCHEVGRLIAALLDTGSTDVDRLVEIARGKLTIE